MRTIRASEIGTYLYCHRAWWYQHQGYEPVNQAELSGGTELHYRHGRTVMISSCLQFAAYGLLLVALIILAIYLTNRLL
jgi:hypothetical protein